MLRAKLYESYLSHFSKFVKEVEIQIHNYGKVSTGQERYFRTVIKLSNESDKVAFDPNWHLFSENLKSLIRDPIEFKLNKFKHLLDESIRADYGPYVDFASRIKSNNTLFKDLSSIFNSDTKFKTQTLQLIEMVKNDWKAGEEDKIHADKYKKFQEIYSKFTH